MDVFFEVGVESLVDLFDELWGGLQIDLGGLDVGMAHEGSQSGQMGVQVFAFPVPLEQSMVGKGVAKGGQPRA